MLSSETSGFVGSIGVGVGACAESRMNLISRLVWGKGGAVLEAMRTLRFYMRERERERERREALNSSQPQRDGL
jgi:hypothetical protein